MSSEKAVVNWSGGKDSALALYRVTRLETLSVSSLLTTVSETLQRVSMHGVRVELLERQAEHIGLPLVKVPLPDMPDMPTYEAAMKESLTKVRADGTGLCVFGDIFLEDLRKYREDKLAELGMRCLFPLWKIPTDKLINEFIDLGFKAIIVCVDEKHLDRSYVGRIIDHSFVNDLPADVDPCGENGEFHSFVFDGPIFRRPVGFKTGEVVHRKYTRAAGDKGSNVDSPPASADLFEAGFWYCDLLPG
jgi:uncharacterized protein (TIGR00290 family)